MKTMKLAAALICATVLNTSLRAQSSEQMTVPLSQPGRPYKLDVSLVDGSITVVGYEGKDIVISVQTEGEKKSNHERSDGLRRLSAGNRADIQAEENNNSVSVHGMVGRVVNLTLKVPANDVTLKLGTVNNGRITVSNVSGELELSDVNDAIRCTNISGSVVANTVNGNVVVVFKSIDPKAAMAFSTLNGNVDVTFPASLKANVKLKSDRGEVYTDFDVATEHRGPAVSHNTNGSKGLYSLKIDEWIYGKIDGGGPEIMMKNMNGNIYIRKAK